MKFARENIPSPHVLSLPSRERGLKFYDIKFVVDPLVVAPFAGAWIEIALSASIAAASVSLPSRERGLKSYAPYIQPHGIPVAPFAGAWIEISVSFGDTNALPSLPSRERGLKFVG